MRDTEDKSSSTIILATRNSGKAREFGRLLGGVFKVEPLPPEIDMPEETGTTFAENAHIKAATIFARLGGCAAVLADDSGLEVTALEGRPGVWSARYAGEGATDGENVTKLLGELEGASDRSARFVCSLCLIVPHGWSGWSLGGGCGMFSVVEVSGYAEGSIELEPRGSEGFGYDPVFRPVGWRETLGEAATEHKDMVSHRGAAARALLERFISERG
jgi:XTP/dITP diphosphohydrolase